MAQAQPSGSQTALHGLVDDLARDIGALRRRFRSNQEWTGAYIADRLADSLEKLHLVIHPSAAELAASVYPDDDEAVDAAIEQVDRRHEALLRLLRPGRA